MKKKYFVNVGFMVPHYALIVVTADDEDEASRLALDQAFEIIPDYVPDLESGGPLQTFDVRRVK